MGRLKDRIAADLKEAMRSRDQLRLDTLRSAISGFTYKRSEAGQELTDTDELDVVRRLVKQRSDSVSEFEKAGRTELAAKERAEREILLAYLPQQKTPAEIREIVQSVLAELPQENRNAGAVMKIVMPALRGLADGNLVRQIVTEALATQ
ncbi:MAG: GatB/YqeY domain-containing protein [Candidatus Eremiobacteraeota bacterium]|nr:GatB/YqeY domain-containing protein [Candidatus Eremiobacteraeota bacterium]